MVCSPCVLELEYELIFSFLFFFFSCSTFCEIGETQLFVCRLFNNIFVISFLEIMKFVVIDI